MTRISVIRIGNAGMERSGRYRRILELQAWRGEPSRGRDRIRRHGCEGNDKARLVLAGLECCGRDRRVLEWQSGQVMSWQGAVGNGRWG